MSGLWLGVNSNLLLLLPKALGITILSALIAIAVDWVIHEIARRMIDESARSKAASDALGSLQNYIERVLDAAVISNKLKVLLLDMAQLVGRRSFAHHMADWIGNGCPDVAEANHEFRELEIALKEVKDKDPGAYDLYLSALRQTTVATLLQWPESAKHLFALSWLVAADITNGAARCAAVAQRIVHHEAPFADKVAA